MRSLIEILIVFILIYGFCREKEVISFEQRVIRKIKEWLNKYE